MKQITHINQHNIRANIKLPKEEQLPVITSKTYKDNTYLHNAEFVCKETGKVFARIVYRSDKPLSCGGRVWIETNTDEVEIKEMNNG